tara:strand:- start:784 stop:1824 length:1041 start_codon:yes stop_codon:yes gene_type:complete
MSEIFVVSNDRFFLEKKSIFNSNKNTFTIINCFKKFKKINLIARNSKRKLKFKDQLKNICIIDVFNLFKKRHKLRFNKILIISLTPYNFLISCLLLLLGAKKKNSFLFLRSDGYEEYQIKFGIIGYFFYGSMLGILKKKFQILSCSKSIKGIDKPTLVFPSEVTDNWLKSRKKQIKIIKKNKPVNLLYLGRFREEKGYLSLINLFEKLKINSRLTMVGNDFKYLKKNKYPKNNKIKIFGQVSSTKKLINFLDKSDIFILPSYVEAYPQVILESLSRLKPVLVFNEIKYLKKTFSFGLYNCERSSYHFEKNLKKMINNYKKIQMGILKRQIYSLKNFELTMNNIFKD